MKSDSIYNTAKASLGSHLTLDPSVPAEVGCAEACSAILQKAGIQGIPQRGFAGTYDLWKWLDTNRQFVQTTNPEVGGIVISPTGTSVQGPNQHGHVGVILKHGIGSNNSNTGIFEENYTYDTWVESFGKRGFPSYFYSPRC